MKTKKPTIRKDQKVQEKGIRKRRKLIESFRTKPSPNKHNNEWNDIKDGLPIGDCVLMVYNAKGYMNYPIKANYDYVLGVFYAFVSGEFYTLEVTHWFAIPNVRDYHNI